ncbi:MAG: grasp-with-spasm system SPASM domain peptide maturase [Saprospiraceae bacterium]|nr:grasp-with-spasm system SPASM domain peptide maturase [Saprospiraceae bacterium]
MVKGFTRTLFCDIQRNSYRFIPNELYDLLNNSRGKSLDEIKKSYENKFDEVIEENLNLLEQEEFIFFTDHPEWFPKLSLEWDEPTVLTNAIIDIDPNNPHDFGKIWKQLSKLGCEHIQIRSFKEYNIALLEEIINKIGSLRIISIEIIIPYDNSRIEKDYIDFVDRQPRIFSLILHSAPENRTVYLSENKMGNVFFSKEILFSKNQCGKISTDFFNVNIKSFTEAHHHNTCLNRKISIDAEGNIRNCPSMPQSFGNIKDTTLQQALDHPDFKKYWNHKKDEIEVCRDCEFRYICTDCRAYLEDPQNEYSKPLKCGYDPYTGEWSEWSTNPLKQAAIKYYGMEEMVANKLDNSFTGQKII